MYKVIDLFAGGGGMSLGFQKAGLDVIAAFENWDNAIECYKNNFRHPIIKQDLSDVDSTVSQIIKFNPDVIIGGPPCQDFSAAGKRVEAERADLTIDYANIISKIRPTMFVMENVDRIRNSAVYHTARNIYKKSGYGLTEVVLDASLYGVPQKRKRFFCIGKLNAEDGYLNDFIESSKSDKPMTIRDYFGDSLGVEAYYRHPRNYDRRGIFSIDEPAPTIRGVNRPVPPGYKLHNIDASKTLDGIRALTTIERSLIQTFPSSYKFVGTKTNLEQIIGNAVPVNLAKFIGLSVKKELNKLPKQYDVEKFKRWLKTKTDYSERTISDVISRIKRSDKILNVDTDDFRKYIYNLEITTEFNKLSPSVKSQMKKSISIYEKFLLEKN